ncbi:MAG: host attachment protein [Proteobacteria bacterium SW_6_67_9]|nr:MAG: host attachment protein [Proteobacteria bacterium SW_6_67_9]
MEATWILVADSARARLFTIDRPRGPLTETAAYVNPQDRLREQDLDADAPGRGAGNNGARFAMGHEDGAKAHYAEQFARELSEVLDKGRQAGAYVRLYIMAAPNFLGAIRRFIDDNTSGCIVESFAKDVVRERADAIRGHLPYRL